MPDAVPLADPRLDQCDVFALVRAERAYQDRKWGGLADHPHEVGAWLLVMKGKFDAAVAAWQTTPNDLPALVSLIKAVAVGVACLEQHAGPLVLKLLADMEFTQTHCGYATPSRRDECLWPALEEIRAHIKAKEYGADATPQGG